MSKKIILCGPTPFDEEIRSLAQLADASLAPKVREKIYGELLPHLEVLQQEFTLRRIDAGELKVIPVVNYPGCPDGTVFTTVPADY